MTEGQLVMTRMEGYIADGNRCRKLAACVIPAVCLFLVVSCEEAPPREEPTVIVAADAYPFRNAAQFESPAIDYLRTVMASGDAEAEAQFWAKVEQEGAPIVEPLPDDERYSIVTFVWHGDEDTNNVAVIDGVAVGVGGADPAQSLMSRLEGSDIWYRSYVIRNDARFHYWLSPNDSLQSLLLDERESNTQPDPLNPNRMAIGPSYLELPGAPRQAATIPNPDYPSGHVEQLIFTSDIINGDRDVYVYTPPGFDPDGPPDTYSLLVAMDGISYTTLVPVPVILDNLIGSGEIPPTVAIIVGGNYRSSELEAFEDFTDFLAEEIVPWAHEKYRTVLDPARTVIGGSSRGGLTSVFTAFRHPEVFGSVRSQSASLWWSPDSDPGAGWLPRQFELAGQLPIVFFQEVGQMEADDMVETNRALRETLLRKGYQFHYQELNHNHTYLHWRGSFADGLVYLMGMDRTGQ